MYKRIFLASLAVVLALFVLASQASAAAPAQAGEPGEIDLSTLVIPFLDEWLSSPHADINSTSFRYWDNNDPAEIPPACAKCHSTGGYLDFLGEDGSEPGVVNTPHAVGSVVECAACHNQTTLTKDSVVMPSGIELTGLGDDARCIECHSGRQSTTSVNAAIERAAVEDDDVSADLTFLNIHYYAAAATKYGTLAKGGYEYAGVRYDANFAHVEGFETCTECHNPHTLQVDIEACATCHAGVETVEDLRDIRMAGSLMDYDGDGDVEEGIYYELVGIKDTLYANIQAYAAEVAGTPIVYSSEAFPYWFIDTNENGEADADEINAGNRFASWTPRLLRAAYNYQTSKKDPGNYVHGGKYIIQLIYDSIADLNTVLTAPADMSAMRRIDAGHFAGSEPSFRYWDATGVVPANCAKCHTDSGLPMFIAEGVNISAPSSNGLQCATCHNDVETFTIYEIAGVTFPSGARIDAGPQSNLCLVCHQGRESTVSVNRLIGDKEADVVSDQLRFLNIHFFAAGATRYGTEVKGAYEYAGKEYEGFYAHARGMSECADCHGFHKLEVDAAVCAECHREVQGPEDLRNIVYYEDDDWDGDPETVGLAAEIDSLKAILYAELQTYASEVIGTGIVYNSRSHPYFFTDTNGNGIADPEESVRANQYNTWTPRLLRAAYNYQYASKDPGAYVHNGLYIIQTLYDSIEDLGGDVAAMVRP